MNSYRVSYQKGQQNRTKNVRLYPFVFTGKEKDEETGYGYFGARYMDHELMTSWLSVDPMSDKYPSISPYAYCAWNPVKLVDPEGTEIDDYFSYKGKYLGSDDAETHNVKIMSATHWNKLEKNKNGTINHEIGEKISYEFSEASELMTESAQLRVYQHYNITKCNLEKLDDKENKAGMRTHFEKGKAPIIRIRLENNRKEELHSICDYADEIINLFAHEKGHITQCNKLGFDNYYKLTTDEQEQYAIRAQMKQSSWRKTRPWFQEYFENKLKKINNLETR